MMKYVIPSSEFICAILIAFVAISPTFAATDNSTSQSQNPILLYCGFSGQATDTDGRLWTGDIGSKYATFNNTNTSQALQSSSLPGSVPFLTARVSTSPFTYSFPLGAGRKFIRLYFYPYDYSGRAKSDAFFSVTAGNYTFLSNFSAWQTGQALNFDYLVKEYSVNVSGDGLDITFTPTTATRSNAYAFINGIEIVSIPDIFAVGSPNLIVGGGKISYSIDPSWAVETVYRLNVGGQAISPVHDSTGLYRSWSDDSAYIYASGFGVTFPKDPNVTINYTAAVPEYVAPKDVYATARSMGPTAYININYNLTWILTVDAGFYYLIRLHFCEIQYPVTKESQRVFYIYLNNQTAETYADVIGMSGGIGKPAFEDYVVITTGSGQMDLWVALHPNTIFSSTYWDAILNGLEVFKLQNTNGSLAGLNPVPNTHVVDVTRIFPNKQNGKHKSKVAPIVGGVVGGIIVVLLAAACVVAMVKRQKKKKNGKEADSSGQKPYTWLPLVLNENSQSAESDKTKTAGSHGSPLPSSFCRHFSFEEMKAATKSFDESLLLGVGGFGKVYYGEIDGGTKVAVKRGNPVSEQGVHEFRTEIELLSKLRHKHLVSLIGFCEENYEMILVYDYMAHGTLRAHLYKTQNPPLTWRQRLEICIGAARGLHYLHTGVKYAIIHRDVKTTNILLDDKWVAKVSDFGLSKTGPTLDQSHISTEVKGSFGYMDPEYSKRQQLTEKSDVYSFGVVLYEVLSARPALDTKLPDEQVNLADWALHCQRKGSLDLIIDPYLMGKIYDQCLLKFTETAEKCLNEVGAERPSMGDVLWSLEFALQLQESAEESGTITDGLSDGATPRTKTAKRDPGYPSTESTTTTTTTTTSFSSNTSEPSSAASMESGGLRPGAVFSQIMNPTGR